MKYVREPKGKEWSISVTLNVWEGRGGGIGEVYKVGAEYLCDAEHVGGEGRGQR